MVVVVVDYHVENWRENLQSLQCYPPWKRYALCATSNSTMHSYWPNDFIKLTNSSSLESTVDWKSNILNSPWEVVAAWTGGNWGEVVATWRGIIISAWGGFDPCCVIGLNRDNNWIDVPACGWVDPCCVMGSGEGDRYGKEEGNWMCVSYLGGWKLVKIGGSNNRPSSSYSSSSSFSTQYLHYYRVKWHWSH